MRIEITMNAYILCVTIIKVQSRFMAMQIELKVGILIDFLAFSQKSPSHLLGPHYWLALNQSH